MTIYQAQVSNQGVATATATAGSGLSGTSRRTTQPVNALLIMADGLMEAADKLNAWCASHSNNSIVYVPYSLTVYDTGYEIVV